MYIIGEKAFDTDGIGQYKARKAYSYFMSGFVHEMFSLNIGTRILVKAKVTASQRLHEEPKNVWILFSKCGDLICAIVGDTNGQCSKEQTVIPKRETFEHAQKAFLV